MDKRELEIWKELAESIREPIQNKRLWKLECETCDSYDHIEGTGCFHIKCRLTGENTWIK